MTAMNPTIDFLYSFEDAALYERCCEAIFAKYAPQGELERRIVSHIAIATWFRRRYAATMHSVLRQIQEVQQSGGSGNQIVGLTRSLVRFNREYRQQKRHISGCRGALKRLRQGEIAELPGESAIPFPKAMEETLKEVSRYGNEFPQAA
jgi:hypothetical protein